MTFIIRARHTDIAISEGDLPGDMVFLIPREQVPALIEALAMAAADAPPCDSCREPATHIVTRTSIPETIHQYCDEHGVTVTPIESVTEATI